ncbi:MAG: hypothetical protein RJB65_421 [Actinomycetota bacterium]|jgi:GNAT superfamily N-acetyltransferase
MTEQQPLPPGYSLGAMTDADVETLISWARAEGWNPGVSDVGIIRAVDPDAFIALRDGDELIGGGAILRVAPTLGFMGLFIVRPDRRSQGLGRVLWHHRRDLLLSRLEPGASIGMDGVYAMADFYARGGFRTAYRDIRYEGPAAGTVDPDVVGLDSLDREEIYRLDAELLGADRRQILERWITAPGVRVAGLLSEGRLVAFGVVRPAHVGYRFGPVLADDVDLARRVLSHLMAPIAGEQVQLDVPEVNVPGITLALGHGWQEAFGCARMYHGPAPDIDPLRVFGVTSFEFG